MNRWVLLNLLGALGCLGVIIYFSSLTGPETDVSPAIRRHPELVQKVESLPRIRYSYAGRVVDNRADPVKFIHMAVRKAGHFSIYGLYGFFLANASAGAGRRGWRRWGAVALAVLAVAVLDEYNQSYMGGRSSLAQDVGVDMAGCLAGLFFSWLIVRPAQRKTPGRS